MTPAQEHALEDLATKAEELVHEQAKRYTTYQPPWARADILAILYKLALDAHDRGATDHPGAQQPSPSPWKDEAGVWHGPNTCGCQPPPGHVDNPGTSAGHHNVMADLLGQQQLINNLQSMRYDAATAFFATPRRTLAQLSHTIVLTMVAPLALLLQRLKRRS